MLITIGNICYLLFFISCFLWAFFSKNPKLQIKVLNPKAIIPKIATEGSAGYDLFCLNEHPIVLEHGSTVRVGIGLAMKIPDGMVGVIQPRSSAFYRGILSNGWIDSDFSGEVFVTFTSINKNTVILEPGKSYAQLILMKYENLDTKLVDKLKETKRGAGGLGSTGAI